ncbi:MAG: hypothetical protein M5T61_19925 [Acidimicrobiia bacterium]|nr:hypothetical protein [Acidimicrobiia bacterium]
MRPAALAYVQQRGATPNKPSLLQMNAGAFTSAQIGESLIRLTGQRHLLDTELEQRRLLREPGTPARRDGHTPRSDVSREELQLESVRRRDRARAHLADAADAWHRHFAAGLLETLERVADLDAAIAEAQARHAELDADLAEAAAALEELRSHTNLEQRVADAERAYERKNSYLEDARVRQQRRVDKRTALNTSSVRSVPSRRARHRGTQTPLRSSSTARAKSEIGSSVPLVPPVSAPTKPNSTCATEAGGAGLAGATLAALRHAGIDAVVLLDSTTINDDRRSFWEPILSRWGDAVVPRPRAMSTTRSPRQPTCPVPCSSQPTTEAPSPMASRPARPEHSACSAISAAQFTEAAVPPRYTNCTTACT